MKKIILGMLISLVLVSGVNAMTGFPHYENVTVSNDWSQNLTDYQVLIHVYYDNAMQSDFDDLRFTWFNETSSSEEELSYCLGRDCPHWNATLELETVNSSHTDVVVKVPKLPASSNTTLKMYFGNSSVSSSSNTENTFDFYDDFDSIDYSKLYTYIPHDDNFCYYSTNNGILNVSSLPESGGSEYTACYLTSNETINAHDRGWQSFKKYKYDNRGSGGYKSPQIYRNFTNSNQDQLLQRSYSHTGLIYGIIHYDDGSGIAKDWSSGVENPYTDFINDTLVLNRTHILLYQNSTLVYSSTSYIPSDANDNFAEFSVSPQTSDYNPTLSSVLVDFYTLRAYSPVEPSACIPNWTYVDYYNCLNSTNLQTERVWTDENYCNAGNLTFNESIDYYPELNYSYSHLTTDCFNTTVVRNWWWYNDTKNCGYYYNTTNNTACFVAICGDTNCSTSYLCSAGSCVVDYTETPYDCCLDCGVPDPFYECKNNVLRDRATERTLSDIGSGTGGLFTGMSTPLAVFIIFLGLASAVGFILASIGKGVGGNV